MVGMSKISSPYIRPATPDDTELMSELGRHTFLEAFRDTVSPNDMTAYLADAFSPSQVAADLADPSSLFLIAFVDHTPAGYSRLYFGGDFPPSVTGPNPVKLWRLYADPTVYGRGIGAALMQESLHTARERGGETLWLTVNIHNARAIAFYAKFGFTIVGDALFRLGNDIHNDYVMARPLSLETLSSPY